jgi:glycosyltransferase involved in cell wall biosynthesis
VLAAAFREDGIRLVHCHNVTALFHGARAARRAGPLPSLFTEHDREMPAPWRHRVLHRWLARRVDRTVAVSARLAGDLVRYEGFPRARTGVLVNGIPDPRERFAGDRAAARSELDLPEGPLLLAVGSLTPVKNHRGLLRILARVLARHPGTRLLVAGDGPLRPELEAEARRLVPDAVVWLGNRDDVPRLLAAADVFVLPSHREGLPLALVEAHAMGRPSVAYDVGGNGEVLLPGESGLLAPAEDEDAFADAVVSLLADPERAVALGRGARQRYGAAFTHERMVEQYVALYEALLDREDG